MTLGEVLDHAATLTTVDDFDRGQLWRFRAKVVRFRDADTVEILADTGFDGRHEAAIRLLGIHAPEAHTPAGDAATAWLELIVHRWSLGHRWPLRVVSLQRERVVSEVQSFDRYVGVIYLIGHEDRLVDLGQLLVDAGHAARVAP